MLTKGAIGNLVNRYRAVLKKCNLINVFGSLAVASMLVLGGAGVAEAEDIKKHAIDTAEIPAGQTLDLASTPINLDNKSDTSVNYLVGINHSTVTDANIGDNASITLEAVTPYNSSGNIVPLKMMGIRTGTSGNITIGDNASINVIADYAGTSLHMKGIQNQGAAISLGENAKILVELTNGNIGQMSGIENYSGSVSLGNNATVKVKAVNATENIQGVYGVFVAAGTVTSENITITAESAKTGDVYGLAIDGGSFTANGNTTITAVGTDAYSIDMRGGTATIGNASSVNTLNGNIYVASSAVLNLNGTTTINGETCNEGSLNLNGTTSLEGDIAGGGTMSVEDGAEIIINNPGTEIDNTVTSTGEFSVSGSGKFNDQGGSLAELKSTFANAAGANVTGMDEGLIAGAVDADGNRKANTVMQDTLDIATSAPLAIGRIVMNDVRKRMGDLRDATGEAGAWMRWDGGKLKGDEGLTNNFNTIQIGADMLTGIQNVRAGVAAAFTHGDLDHRNGNGEMETYSFSAYGTWMADNGMFADVIARVGFTNTELSMKGRTIDLDNEALSLSGEYGWRFDLCQQFYVEPQVELTYTYVTEADSKIDYATYEVDSLDSLLGRAGMAFGWKLPDDRGNIYARASVVHEFLGDAKITGSAFSNTEVHELDGEDTWLEYGIGANVKLTDKTYIWADVERTEGADIDEEWRGTVGIRYSF